MQDDQVSQDARAAEAELYRTWDQFEEWEKGAALRELATFMKDRSAWTREATAVALLRSIRMDPDLNPSPVAWAELSRQQLAQRLSEVAAWDDLRPDYCPPYLRDACLEMADELSRRERRHERGGRER